MNATKEERPRQRASVNAATPLGEDSWPDFGNRDPLTRYPWPAVAMLGITILAIVPGWWLEQTVATVTTRSVVVETSATREQRANERVPASENNAPASAVTEATRTSTLAIERSTKAADAELQSPVANVVSALPTVPETSSRQVRSPLSSSPQFAILPASSLASKTAAFSPIGNTHRDREPMQPPEIATLQPEHEQPPEIASPADIFSREYESLTGSVESATTDVAANSPSTVSPIDQVDVHRQSLHETYRRAERLESLARLADARTRSGFELAARGAPFAARREFIAALRIVAQGLDTEDKTKRHSEALAAGLRALEQADDFLPGVGQLEAELDVARIAEGHQTDVLRGADLPTVTPLAALQAYLTTAQQHLGESVRGEIAGSMALRGLGKLYEQLDNQEGVNVQAAQAKAIVFYQAAILAAHANHLAANDLGVLLARNGRWEQARAALRHAASLAPSTTIVRNLAVVCERLGDAPAAAYYYQLVRQFDNGSTADRPIRWVDQEAFTRQGEMR